MSCENCAMDDDSFIKLSSIYENHYTKPITIIGMLESYAKKNESESNDECVREFNKLIIQSKNIAFLLNFFNKLPNFNKFCTYLNSYLINLSNYMNSVNNLQMDNIYLFLKNIIVISTCQSNKYLLSIYGQFYLNNIRSMNVSKLHTYILKGLSEGNKNPNLDLINKTLKENSNDLNLSLLKISDKYNSLNTTILKEDISSLKNQIRIEYFKNDIIKFLDKYHYSYNIILSKKVLEMKLITEIIYTLLKYNHDKLDKISILNFIKKERNIFTEEDELILNKYVSSNPEDSYTRMNNSKDIHSNKLQVILEFLFFLRDKTIDIINLLNDNAILFFQFLTNNAKEDIDENNDDKNRINYK